MAWIKWLFGWMFGWLFSDAPPVALEVEEAKKKRLSPADRKLSQHLLYKCGKSPIGHATGAGFVDNVSTTKAVRTRMKNIRYYLRGELPPVVKG